MKRKEILDIDISSACRMPNSSLQAIKVKDKYVYKALLRGYYRKQNNLKKKNSDVFLMCLCMLLGITAEAYDILLYAGIANVGTLIPHRNSRSEKKRERTNFKKYEQAEKYCNILLANIKEKECKI